MSASSAASPAPHAGRGARVAARDRLSVGSTASDAAAAITRLSFGGMSSVAGSSVGRPPRPSTSMRMSELEGAAAAVDAVVGAGTTGRLAEPSSLTSALFARGLPAVGGGGDPVRGTGWPAGAGAGAEAGTLEAGGAATPAGALSATMGGAVAGGFGAAGDAVGGEGGWGVAALDLSASSAMDVSAQFDGEAVGQAGSPEGAGDDDSSAMDLDESSSG